MIGQRGFEVPQIANSYLWRYMTVESFIMLMQKRTMYFRHYLGLGDDWEGAPLWSDIQRGFDPFLRQVSIAFAQYPNGEIGDLPNVVADAERGILEPLRKLPNVGVSCWHQNTIESAAMWKIYAGQDKGIAIKVALEDIAASFLEPLELTLSYGAVKYLDHDNATGVVLKNTDNLFVKRPQLDYEREVRIIAVPNGDPANMNMGSIDGYEIPVNADQLLRSVVVGPLQPPRTLRMIQDLMKMYDFIPDGVTRSVMAETPEEYIDRHTKI